MTAAAGGPDDRWLGATQVSLTGADVADALAVAMDARMRLPEGWGRVPRAGLGALLAAIAGLAIWLLPPDVAAGTSSLCVMGAIVVSGRVPHRLLVLIMAPAAWVTVRQSGALMDAYVAWGRTGLHAAGQGSAAITLWSEIDGWGERRTLVLRKPGSGYVIIPKRSMTAAQIDAIRSLLTEAGVPHFGQPDARTGGAVTAVEPLVLDAPGRRRVTVRLTLGELVAARRFAVLRGVLTQTTALVAILVMIAAWWFGWTAVPGQPMQTAALAIGAGLTYAIGLRLVLPLLFTGWQVRRNIRLRRGAGEDFQVEWDEAGFRCAYVNGEVEKRWADVRRYDLAKAFVFLSLGPNFGQTIPRRALDPAQLADLRACAAAAGVRGA